MGRSFSQVCSSILKAIHIINLHFVMLSLPTGPSLLGVTVSSIFGKLQIFVSCFDVSKNSNDDQRLCSTKAICA